MERGPVSRGRTAGRRFKPARKRGRIVLLPIDHPLGIDRPGRYDIGCPLDRQQTVNIITLGLEFKDTFRIRAKEFHNTGRKPGYRIECQGIRCLAGAQAHPLAAVFRKNHEKIIHTFNADPGFWHTQFTLDPYPLSPENQLAINFLVFNNTTYGIIGNYVSTTTGSLNVAGATSLYVTSATGTGTSVIKANMDLSVGVPGSTTFESVIVSSSYTSGTTIPITTPLLYTHASGVAVVSANSIQ